MKNVVKLTALSIAFGSSVAMASDNIAFINTEYLFAKHPARQVELQKLDEEFKAPAEKLQAADKALVEKRSQFEKEIETKAKALEKDAPKLRQADIKKRQDEIAKLAEKRNAEFNKLLEEHQKNVAEFQANGQKREAEINQRLLTEIQTATTNVAKAKNFTIVLDEKTAVYFADGKNITEEVLKAIPAPAQAK
ncbi:OmpH family outer membrane protein [Haemophilus haemoglobinophilus]|nr:OmpH family outer membrane protein [Canicola haemoglobinophilus]MBN6711702.1 OmpH family outer membrane protein [Canicola haemoglobinophilus]